MESQGEILKLAIKNKGLTVAEASAAIGVSRQTMQTYFKSAKLTKKIVDDVKTYLHIDLTETKTAPEVDAEYLNLVREQMKNVKNQVSILEELLRRTDQ